jgi:hypothetical protein
MISTLTSRITALGLADIRGALGVGFDEGAWINTAFTASQMFIGPIAVWAAFLLGTRRVLLTGAVVFMLAETLLPLSPNFACFIFLEALAGLSSGVFVPITVGFIARTLSPKLIPFDIAAYAMNLEMSLNCHSRRAACPPRIRAKSYTDNVVDLMIGKLKRASAATQKALIRLACLGNFAAVTTLLRVQEEPEERIHS